MDSKPLFPIRSRIKPELMRFTLMRGTGLAAAGSIMLLTAGTLMPPAYLNFVGIPIFLTALFLITLGLLPYRKLAQLEIRPHVLEENEEAFFFLKQGKPLFIIPKKSIEKMQYVEKGQLYGLAIWIKKDSEKIKVLQARFNFKAFAAMSAQQFEGCTLFLPYIVNFNLQ